MVESPQDRPAVRIVCVDGTGRILLLRWRDPVSERDFWEPPGGGLDPGESPLAAARRELEEETGLPGDAVLDLSVPVDRDFHWNGVHYRKVEPFYLARFEGTVRAAPAAFTAEENETYLGNGWFTAEEIPSLDDVDPPRLLEVLAALMRRQR
ncbi:NUDIX hydrolase [Actinomadura scrupuli]|uniref:NUDIX hydrolase n=1 Tax=Actinomadura scrupuli TaxID=559629 RepID=UPI003D98B61F